MVSGKAELIYDRPSKNQPILALHQSEIIAINQKPASKKPLKIHSTAVEGFLHIHLVLDFPFLTMYHTLLFLNYMKSYGVHHCLLFLHLLLVSGAYAVRRNRPMLCRTDCHGMVYSLVLHYCSTWLSLLIVSESA
jgi:hypothetical protein